MIAKIHRYSDTVQVSCFIIFHLLMLKMLSRADTPHDSQMFTSNGTIKPCPISYVLPDIS